MKRLAFVLLGAAAASIGCADAVDTPAVDTAAPTAEQAPEQSDDLVLVSLKVPNMT